MSAKLRYVPDYYALVHAVAGTTGSAVALSALYPLDYLRTRLQTDDSLSANRPLFEEFPLLARFCRFFKINELALLKDIVAKDGWGTVYRGLPSAIPAVSVSQFVYFYVYNFLKVLKFGSRAEDMDAMSPITNLVLSYIAGTVNVLTTSPLWTIATRLKIQQKNEYDGALDCFRRTVKEEGVAALWNGVGASLILVANPAIEFTTYGLLRRSVKELARVQGREISGLEFFAMGGLAKFITTIITYPIQVVQNKLRAQKQKEVNRKKYDVEGARQPAHYTGIVDCLTQVWQKDGLSAGLYKGIGAKLWQTCLMAAMKFLTYEEIARLVFYIMLRGKPVVR